MFRRALTIGLLGVTMALLRGGDGRAHLQGYQFDPTLRHVSSHDCFFHLEKIPGWTIGNSEAECTLTVQEVEVACQNPGSKEKVIINPGHFPVVISAADLIREGDLLDQKKTRGKVFKRVHLGDADLLAAGDAACSALWRNWRAAAVRIVRTFVVLQTADCLDGACVSTSPAWCAKLECETTVGSDVGFDTEYNFSCELVAEEHLDGSGACPFLP